MRACVKNVCVNVRVFVLRALDSTLLGVLSKGVLNTPSTVLLPLQRAQSTNTHAHTCKHAQKRYKHTTHTHTLTLPCLCLKIVRRAVSRPLSSGCKRLRVISLACVRARGVQGKCFYSGKSTDAECYLEACFNNNWRNLFPCHYFLLVCVVVFITQRWRRDALPISARRFWALTRSRAQLITAASARLHGPRYARTLLRYTPPTHRQTHTHTAMIICTHAHTHFRYQQGDSGLHIHICTHAPYSPHTCALGPVNYSSIRPPTWPEICENSAKVYSPHTHTLTLNGTAM